MSKSFFVLFLLLTSQFSQAQKLKKEDKQLLANLQKHIQFLADEKLEGRRTGTPGEAAAAAYIASQFSAAGLRPKGTKEFLQPFDINEGKQINPSTLLAIDGKNLEVNKDFFPPYHQSQYQHRGPAFHKPAGAWHALVLRS